jgi:hypothetical protein
MDERSISKTARRAETSCKSLTDLTDFDRGRRAWTWDARIAKKPRLAIAQHSRAPMRPHPRPGRAVSGRYDQSGADRGCLAALPRMWRARAAGRDSVASRRGRQVASWSVLHGLRRRASRLGRGTGMTTLGRVGRVGGEAPRRQSSAESSRVVARRPVLHRRLPGRRLARRTGQGWMPT